MPSRRFVLRTGLGAAAALSLPRPLLARTRASARPWLDAALAAARWLEESMVTSAHGVAWPADPARPESVRNDLYSGTPGVVLFLLELHAATGDAAWLDLASAGAEHLAATIANGGAIKGEQAGLYTGAAGVAFVLAKTHEATRRAADAEAARRALALVHGSAREAGAGVEWSPVTDIISGGSGIGLTLLWAAKALGDAPSRALAERAGRRLLELGKPAEGGTSWAMTPTFARDMPNFSHGTAGVSYFLARLYEETRDRAFLDGALAGAGHLRTIATRTREGGSLVYHHTPDGKDLYYLGWCHGPVGTTRLYHVLGRATGDARWAEEVRAGAKALAASGIPERRTPGFWNNVGQCCGNAGVADWFLTLHRELGDAAFLDFARRVATDTMRRATAEGDTLRWIQAEHRVQPTLLIAQTGYMQGAAGIGTMFLHLDAHERGARPRITLPDSPW